MKVSRSIAILSLLLAFAQNSIAQNNGINAIDYAISKTYEIGGITVSGNTGTDANAVKLFAGLKVGDKIEIPGDRIPRAIKNLWEQKLFSDIQIEAAEIRGTTMFLHIKVLELPRFSRRSFPGLSRSEVEKLTELFPLRRGQQVNESVISRIKSTTRKFFVEKGHLKTTVEVDQIPDTLLDNSARLVIRVDKGPKVKIKDIKFEGNENIESATLRGAMKGTKRKRWYNIFGSSKFIRADFDTDLGSVIDVYNAQGYRNAEIVSDSLYYVSDNRISLKVRVDEDGQFHFRNIAFTGNTKHSDAVLRDIVGFTKGDVYNKELLDSRLFMSQTGRDISSLYMDDGYLGFYPQAIESLVPGDSIDLEIRMNEGRQYRVRNIIIKGNTKTYDRVIRREIRTKPGDLFNRSDILRTQQELARLGYFNPQTLGVNPIQDAATGMVDLEYTVEEQPSDRLELSGGWGAGRLVMTLGLSFTNFSLRNIFNTDNWQPLPAGDGQTLNLRAQTNGRFFQSYSMSFVEPWLGGRKPNSLSTSIYYTNQTNGVLNRDDPARQKLGILGASVGLGRRLPWPDDYFILRTNISYQKYDLDNWRSLFSFSDGVSHVLTGEIALERNSLQGSNGGLFYPDGGASIRMSVKATLPYVNWGLRKFDDIESISDAERYRFAEFHKWKFTTQWYNKITSNGKMVLALRGGLGFLGNYNDDLGDSPFERFFLGGAALTGFRLDGREIIGLRGYDDLSLSPNTGDFLVGKYTSELRYLVSANPSAQIYTSIFMEAGNTWGDFDNFNPFQLYRSAGFGLRLNLPMFGPMGLDYGWRLDDVPGQPSMARSQFHFTIGIDLGEL
jgi:outer membrane protein insertion porin family